MGREINVIKNDVLKDYKKFYGIKNLGKLAIGLGVAGALANTSADRKIQHHLVSVKAMALIGVLLKAIMV